MGQQQPIRTHLLVTNVPDWTSSSGPVPGYWYATIIKIAITGSIGQKFSDAKTELGHRNSQETTFLLLVSLFGALEKHSAKQVTSLL